MPIRCGIVGLPNVGKSTLFNALTRAQIAAENYPFCTIDPNIGIVTVPDARLEVLRQIAFKEPRPPSRLNQAVPAELETIVLKAMAKEPSGRYASAHAMANDLRLFLADRTITALLAAAKQTKPPAS